MNIYYKKEDAKVGNNKESCKSFLLLFIDDLNLSFFFIFVYFYIY
jgi:hypothetical protein